MATPPNVYSPDVSSDIAAIRGRLVNLEGGHNTQTATLNKINSVMQEIQTSMAALAAAVATPAPAPAPAAAAPAAAPVASPAELQQMRTEIQSLRIEQARLQRCTQIDFQETVTCRSCKKDTRRTVNGKCQQCSNSMAGDVVPDCEYPGCWNKLARGVQIIIFWNSDQRLSKPCRECLRHVCNPCWERLGSTKPLRGTPVAVCGECAKGILPANVATIPAVATTATNYGSTASATTSINSSPPSSASLLSSSGDSNNN